MLDKKAYEKRVLHLNGKPVDNAGECVIYWMQRSQRAEDNLALNFACDLADDIKKPVVVYFGLYDKYPLASVRAFKFMIEGLKETAARLAELGIGFVMRRELPPEGVVKAAREFGACAVVVDEDYLNLGRSWRSAAADELDVGFFQVDAETIVPARLADKEEWGAYTLRPKLLKVLPRYFIDIPRIEPIKKWTRNDYCCVDTASVDPAELSLSLDADQDVRATPYFIGGASEAEARFGKFIAEKLPRYKEERNEIGVSVSSDASPYFHFGQMSSLRAALMVDESDAPRECIDAFLEQIIVRRELAINFCLYNPLYDKLQAAADWAYRTLDSHRNDPRVDLYSLEELEAGETHDDLWNAAQMELVKYGKIHPYIRMVWAKKLLEWSPTPEEALSRAIYLNDKYALDGRDPNGYTNIAWCIFGKHDRPFGERPIFGKIRYMSSESTKKKYLWQDYITRIDKL